MCVIINCPVGLYSENRFWGENRSSFPTAQLLFLAAGSEVSTVAFERTTRRARPPPPSPIFERVQLLS